VQRACRRCREPPSSLARRAVDELAHGVGMPCVTSRLVDQVDERPAQGSAFLAAVRRVGRQLADDSVRPLCALAIGAGRLGVRRTARDQGRTLPTPARRGRRAGRRRPSGARPPEVVDDPSRGSSFPSGRRCASSWLSPEMSRRTAPRRKSSHPIRSSRLLAWSLGKTKSVHLATGPTVRSAGADERKTKRVRRGASRRAAPNRRVIWRQGTAATRDGT
jgi:hypothetical protein